MKELLPLLCERLRKRLPVVLASLIADEGSTPRAAGADLLADADGLLAGTVGGGLGEAKTLEACREALKDGKARLLDFALQGEFSATSAMICGRW